MEGFASRRPYFDPDTDLPDLSGEVYVLTGGSRGIGFGTITHLLRHNVGKVITLSSNEAGARKGIEKLQAYGDTSRVEWHKCDLTSLKEVDRVAKMLRQKEKRIDGLILNSGVGIAKYGLTEDGLERAFQINVISQFHLALMLLPTLHATALKVGKPSRVLMTSSLLYASVPETTKFENIDDLNLDVGPFKIYDKTKLAQILLVKKFARKLDAGDFGLTGGVQQKTLARTVLVNAISPGMTRTSQADQVYNYYGWLAYLACMPIYWLMMVDPISIGCRSTLFAATANDRLLAMDDAHGQYIIPDAQIREVAPVAKNEQSIGSMWKLSLNILREKLGKLDYDFDTSKLDT